MKVLITGGSGLLGRHISAHLSQNGFEFSVLSRQKTGKNTYSWDPDRNQIDPAAITGVDSIIHLAGAGIADKRWTSSYKKQILESRIKSARLLLDTIRKTPQHTIKTLVSASAVGYYGDSGDTWVDELSPAENGFLGSVCTEWENSALEFEKEGIRVVILRIGIVLARDGGALPSLAMPVRLFAGAPLGNGKQYLSWIHIADLSRLFTYAVSNEKLHGIYNAVSPGPVTNKTIIREIASVLHRPVWPFAVPAFLIKMILGEKAAIVLRGQRVSSEKISRAGFEFNHLDLSKTLNELLK